VGDTFQEREIRVLSSQMRQALIQRLQYSVRALAKLKNNGKKARKTKFKRAIHSIPLIQHVSTHWIKMNEKKVHIQGLGDFKVVGIEQIPANAELTTANLVEKNRDYYLVEKNRDYYLHITCYFQKETKPQSMEAIGIDFGVKNQVSFSNDVKLSYSIPD
jgi:putative transposase